ncbi:hypothetical protein [Aureivirga sp. CE67]|uniref:hypothetical protein n=1 Tax=Aureivirga sp. CE67 TaxID=1788983 RepID=UPI0018CAE70F|nr:hypothetical protein [Aureivirga sp. CE67]
METKFLTKLILICCTVFFISCSDDDTTTDTVLTLEKYAANFTEIDDYNVIACASSAKNDNNTAWIFFYPIEGATNFKYFETNSINDAKDNLANYKEITNYPLENVFNGHLRRFVKENENESWVIITYEVGEKFYTSNPIYLKHNAQPTNWISEVNITKHEDLRPSFEWSASVHDNSFVFFEVISELEGDLLSGTYTYEPEFTYLDFSNVSLSVHHQTPPELEAEKSYNFTMMGVSEDNWVNTVIQKEFKP